jgi:hypothetical protein
MGGPTMSESTEKTERAETTCAVCGRRLLVGERAVVYVSREGAEAEVCELCKERAEAAGWLRPEDAEARRGSETGRRPGRRRGELLGGLLERVERERASRAERRRRTAEERRSRSGPERQPGEDAERAPSGGGERPAERPSESEERPRRSTAGPDVNEAVTAFNASENRRTVAGLSRSLGRPQATVLAVRTASGHPGARLTVAWELAWYQWEIGPGRHGPEVRQIAKGETIDQLRAADRNWNLELTDDGLLRRRGKVSGGDGSG